MPHHVANVVYFLAAYAAVNGTTIWPLLLRNFLAAYAAVNRGVGRSMLYVFFLAAYAAVNMARSSER